jgi:RNA polymerase subunit RPABC4/transcription elongation factor Spt4
MSTGQRTARPPQGDSSSNAVGILLGIAGAAAIAYALSRIFDGDQERCPYCGAFVSQDSSICRNCRRRL